jgi:glutaredoxin 3
MPEVVIYTKPMCPYCARAVNLLKKKSVAFQEIEAGWDPAKRQEMLARANGRATYPQIFIGERHVGGCDDLMALETDGSLDALLTA